MTTESVMELTPPDIYHPPHQERVRVLCQRAGAAETDAGGGEMTERARQYSRRREARAERWLAFGVLFLAFTAETWVELVLRALGVAV